MRLNWAWPDKSSRTALPGPLKGSKQSEGRVERGKETFFFLNLCRFYFKDTALVTLGLVIDGQRTGHGVYAQQECWVK